MFSLHSALIHLEKAWSVRLAVLPPMPSQGWGSSPTVPAGGLSAPLRRLGATEAVAEMTVCRLRIESVGGS